MPFLNSAVMTPHKGGRWKMLEPFNYLAVGDNLITIPKGFVHDLASIPKVFRMFFSVNGPHRNAAILHDWGYYKGGYVSEYLKLKRVQVDKLFLNAMKETGVGYFKRYAMYYAVRVGGFRSFGPR